MLKGRLPILCVNVCGMVLFTAIFLAQHNYEFLYYMAAIVFSIVPIGAIIISTDSGSQYSTRYLWLLTLWSLMHIAGGLVYVGGVRLYDMNFMSVLSYYGVFRWDRVVHLMGFALITYGLCRMRMPWHRLPVSQVTAVAITMVSLIFLHEGFEQVGAMVLPQTGVGDSIDTIGDMIADFLGIIIAMVSVRYFNDKRK